MERECVQGESVCTGDASLRVRRGGRRRGSRVAGITDAGIADALRRCHKREVRDSR